MKQNAVANCVAITAILKTLKTVILFLIENLRLCSFAEAGIFLYLFLNF